MTTALGSSQRHLLNEIMCLIFLCGTYLCVAQNVKKSVYVYHFMVNHWGTSHEGVYDCSAVSSDFHCEWTHADHIRTLSDRYYKKQFDFADDNTVTVGLYNIHSWWEKTRSVHPAFCELPTNLTMVESEESRVRYNSLFEPSFKHFDGVSTTSPTSQVQRVYHEAFLFELNVSNPVNSFANLVKGGSYVASDCHRRDAANSNRDGIIHLLRLENVRIDGLGRCMRSAPNAEGIAISHTADSRYNLEMKRIAIGKYLFHMAFENSIEPGYVTEKPFDALIAGTVPVYLGDSDSLRQLLPHPKSAIFVSDYNGNFTALGAYLNYLASNETAYEEHRAWRYDFSIENHRNKTLLRYDWECRICQWALTGARIPHPVRDSCGMKTEHKLSDNVPKALNISEYEGKAVKGTRRTVYFVQNGILRPIPDFDTFMSLKLDPTKTKVFNNDDIASLPMGEPLPKVSARR